MLLLDDLGKIHLFRRAFVGPGDYFSHLSKQIQFHQNQIRLYGKTLAIPRLEAWFGDHSYRYSGHTLEPQPWIPKLLELKSHSQELSGFRYNSCLVNFYRNGQDYCAWHSDDEKVLGPAPAIASVSLGEGRRFLLRKKKSPRERIEVMLNDGDLLVMSGELQKHWEHSLAKTAKVVGPRINVTFREIF